MLTSSLKFLNNPLMMRSSDLNIVEMGTAMSRINRYCGRGKFKVSIAQHQTLLSYAVPRRLALAAHTHDVIELWFSDIPSPVLKRHPELQQDQDRLLMHIGYLIGVPWGQYQEIHPFDIAIRNDEMWAMELITEKRSPMLDIPIEPMREEDAAGHWIRRFFELTMEARNV